MRRRHALVAPFVVTVINCGSGTPPSKEPLTTAPSASTPEVKPEAPSADAAAPDAEPAPPPAPAGPGAWRNHGTPEAPRWVFVYQGPESAPKKADKFRVDNSTPSQVELGANGTCVFEPGMDCPPDATCNPPPPYPVQCPPGLEEAKRKLGAAAK